jgi:integrase
MPKAKQASIRPILRTGKKYAKGHHPICISISKSGKAKYRVISGLSCPRKYWSMTKNRVLDSYPKAGEYNKIIREHLNQYINAQDTLVAEGQSITPERIVEKAEHPPERTTILSFYEEVTNELAQKGNISNSNHYRDIRNQFANFLKSKNKEDILFSDLDYNLLKQWETHLRERGAKDTTLYAYFKNLRALYNEAVKRKHVPQNEENPFNTFKVSQFNRSTKKRVLSIEEIRKMEALDLSEDRIAIREARRFALFSYYVSGMNLTDMALIEWKHMEGDFLKYRRKKTGMPIIAPLIEEPKQIIEEMKPDTADTPYIFPILDPEKHKSERQIKDRIQKVRSRTNEALKEIAKRAEINDPGSITMYTFRHSFASHLWEKGADLWTIMKTLGHSNLEQTQKYLAELGAEELMEEVQKLGKGQEK